VEERHGQADTVAGGQLLTLADVESVVQDVAMREHDALGEPRGAARVLHHHHIVVAEGRLSVTQHLVVGVIAQQQQLRHTVETAMLLGPHVDEVLEEGVLRGLEMPALLGEGFGHQTSDDLDVIHIAVLVHDAERLHVGLFQHVVELVALVDRVHRDHHDAHLGGGVHEGEPVGDVTGPDPQMVAGFHPDGQEPLGQGVGALVEIAVGPAQGPVGIDDELMVGLYRHLVAEIAPDGLLRMELVFVRSGLAVIDAVVHLGGHGIAVDMVVMQDTRVRARCVLDGNVLIGHGYLLERGVDDCQEARVLLVVRANLVGHDGIVVDALAGFQDEALTLPALAVLDLYLALETVEELLALVPMEHMVRLARRGHGDDERVDVAAGATCGQAEIAQVASVAVGLQTLHAGYLLHARPVHVDGTEGGIIVHQGAQAYAQGARDLDERGKGGSEFASFKALDGLHIAIAALGQFVLAKSQRLA